MSTIDHDQTGGFPSTSEVLRSAESGAIRIRKLLRTACDGGSAWGSSSAMHDALRLAQLIERLAAYGQKVRAADAIQIADYVERLLDVLLNELDHILACGCQHGGG